jgi:hypothetical protein
MRRGQKVFDIAQLSDVVYTKIRAAVLETLNVSDEADFYLSKLQKSVGDIISVSDLVDYLIHEYVRQNATDDLSVSDAVNFVLSSINRITAAASDSLSVSDLLKALRKDFAPSDTLSLSESVSYQLTTQQQQQNYYIPYSYQVLNHNWQEITANLAVWWDNDTSTTYPLYFSPPTPYNPRYAYLYFNNPISLPRNIEIFVSSYTSGKTLIINAFYSGDPSSSVSLTPSRSGWFTVTLPLTEWGDAYFDELQIYGDANIIGIIVVAEFHVLQN